jgi:hypothetical protein
MRRPKIGSVLAAVALAASALVPMLASPASAAPSCSSGEFPATFGGESALKVACTTDAGVMVNNVAIHDADNVVWHHGAARNVSLTCVGPCAFVAPAGPRVVTAGNKVIKFNGNPITAADVRRPISAFTAANALVFPQGTFIVSVVAGKATLSQAACAACNLATVTVRIEHTNNRVLVDATCPAGVTSTLTSPTAKWVASDFGKSLTGGPFPAGTYLIGPIGGGGTTIQFTPALGAGSVGCTTNNGGIGAQVPTVGADRIVVGATTYAPANVNGSGLPQVFDSDPLSIHLSNLNGIGQGFSCPTAGTLKLTAAAIANAGDFVPADVGLDVHIAKNTATSFDARITAVNTLQATITFAPALCTQNPAYVTATSGWADIGVHGENGPASGAAFLTLGAELDLNPALVFTQDDCRNGTFEGIDDIGEWQNPDSYTDWQSNLATPIVTVAEVLVPTSVLTFAGFVAPAKSGDQATGLNPSPDPNPHYDVMFSLLPSSVAQCLDNSGLAGLPTEGAHITFGMAGTTLWGLAQHQLWVGDGNQGDPALRSLLPETGSFSQTVDLGTNASVSNSFTPVDLGNFTGPACTIGAPTVGTGFACGDG